MARALRSLWRTGCNGRYRSAHFLCRDSRSSAQSCFALTRCRSRTRTSQRPSRTPRQPAIGRRKFSYVLDSAAGFLAIQGSPGKVKQCYSMVSAQLESFSNKIVEDSFLDQHLGEKHTQGESIAQRSQRGGWAVAGLMSRIRLALAEFRKLLRSSPLSIRQECRLRLQSTDLPH
jgi:hypothetical protein